MQRFCAVLILAGALCVCNAAAQSPERINEFDFPPQLVQPSPRAGAMGGASVALVDMWSPFTNPAALGLLYRNSKLSIATYPGWQELAPETWPGLEYHFFTLSGAIGIERLFNSPNYVAGAAYSRTSFQISDKYSFWPPVPENVTQSADKFSLGLAYLTESLELSGGLSYAYLSTESDPSGAGVDSSDFDNSGYAFDFGLLLHWNKYIGQAVFTEEANLVLTRALAVSFNNIGPEWSYDNAPTKSAQPKLRRIGAALTLAAQGDDYEVYHFTATFQEERLLTANATSDIRFGGGIGWQEAIAARIGIFNPETEKHVITCGFRFDLMSFLRNGTSLIPTETADNSDNFSYIMQNLRLGIDYSRYEQPDDLTLLNKRDFIGLFLAL